MKVKSVAALAGAGMLFSSVSVWSLTGPEKSLEVGSEAPSEAPHLVRRPVEPAHVGASFTSGRTLALEGRLGHARLLADTDNSTLLLVNVTADAADAPRAPSPLNLAIVVDRSGSMRGQRMQNAIDGARGMVRRLRDGDVVSLIAYNQSAEVLVSPTTVDASARDRVSAALAGITPQGDTCISCGLDEGMAQLRRRSGMLDRILLLSDGEPTTGVRDLEGFRALGARIRNMGASISSVGVDVEYNERVMNVLAIESNGRHHFVENAGDLPRVFDQELETLAKSMAKNAEVAIALAPGVDAERVFDRTFRREGNTIFVPLGSFSQGEEKTLLIALRVPRGASGQRPIANVSLTYDELAEGSSSGLRQESHGELHALYTDDPGSVSELDPMVLARMQRSETSAVLNEANDLYAAGRPEEARQKLRSRRDALDRERSAALGRAPAPAKQRLEQDFGDQSAALGKAERGLAPPAAQGADPAAAQRKARAQVRVNATRALDFAF